jgi:hypothetical protein
MALSPANPAVANARICSGVFSRSFILFSGQWLIVSVAFCLLDEIDVLESQQSTQGAKSTSVKVIGVSLLKENSGMSQKPATCSAESQTCITTICSCAVYEWEFQEGEDWMPMDARTSTAIEVKLSCGGEGPDAVSSGVRGDKILMYGNYEFDLSSMKQKNVMSKRSRSIRRGQTLINDWETVFEREKALELELSQSEDRNKLLAGEIQALQDKNKALELELIKSENRNKILIKDHKTKENALDLELSQSKQKLASHYISINILRSNLALNLALINGDLDILRSDLVQGAKLHADKLLELHGKLAVTSALKMALEEELRSLKEKRDLDQARITKLQTQRVTDNARIKKLVTDNTALDLKLSIYSGKLDFCDFQLTILQQLHAMRSLSEGHGKSARLACSSSSTEGWLQGFRRWVEKQFFGTRVCHRKTNLANAVVCEPPEFEVMEVEAIINPDLAERQRQFMQQAESDRGATKQYRAHRVASPVSEGMKVRSLCAGAEGVDEGMLLGWHGASDDVVSKIILKGFNPCCAGSGSGSMFGKGIYFAENSSKADLYAGPHPSRFAKHAGSMSVILAAVFCGNMFEAKTRGSWTEPPSPTDSQTCESGIIR